MQLIIKRLAAILLIVIVAVSMIPELASAQVTTEKAPQVVIKCDLNYQQECNNVLMRNEALIVTVPRGKDAKTNMNNIDFDVYGKILPTVGDIQQGVIELRPGDHIDNYLSRMGDNSLLVIKNVSIADHKEGIQVRVRPENRCTGKGC
ncbi:hypothetical protein PCC7424_4374 [Gloeothece citriformis PCC 7424]|uniref:Uncharacterized protein n=1 Tax=Gloeothece citriformis (strain PCC 7424) TaxID=65393 RepID=B7K8X0_GLOC7|nr:hypothetical protein [Gloeothece citriformis]ACK72739.1 hypothetical protein PCC7424_4374 [Gloeothece citriformis PCC 7424]